MKNKLSLIMLLSMGIYVENATATKVDSSSSVASEESDTNKLDAEKSIQKQQKAMDDARHIPGQLKIAEAIGRQMQHIIDESSEITAGDKDHFIRSFAKIQHRLGQNKVSLKMLRDWVSTKQASLITRLTYADNLYHNGQEKEALAEWSELTNIPINNSLDKYVSAKALICLGNARVNDVRQIPHYRAALALEGISNDLQAQALIGLGNARDGDRVEHYREALSLGITGDLRAQALIGLGNARDGQNGGVKHYHEALALGITGDLRAQALIGLGNARDGQDGGVKHYNEALSLGITGELRAQALIGLGNARDGGNQNVKHYNAALSLGITGDLRAQALIGLGNARDGQKHYHEALALGITGELRAQALIGLGNARDGQDGGVKHYNEALALGITGDLRAQALIGLGNARADGVQIPYYHEALALGITGDLRAQALIGLGNARDGDRVAHYHEALALGITGDLRAQALIGLGNARADGVQRPYYHDALALGITGELRAQALIGLGNTLCGQRENIKGMVYYHRAAEIVGKGRTQVGGKQGFVETELRNKQTPLSEDEREAIGYFFPQLLDSSVRATDRDSRADTHRSSRPTGEHNGDSRFTREIAEKRDALSQVGQKRKADEDGESRRKKKR